MVGETTNEAPAIELRGLRRRFGETVALDGVDLRVPRGACFGLLGPNGAGKTTTVGILTTLLRPGGGTARLLGRDVVEEAAAVRREVGLVFQEPTLDLELSARETLDLTARLYHLEDRRERVEEVLSLVRLEDVADRTARGYSGGLRRRLEIGRGLLHRPRVLFLDEPTLGLDVAARAAIWEHLRFLHAQRETTLFLTTHSMEEADALCEQLAILDRGRVVAEGTPEGLKAELGGDVVSLTLEVGEGAEERLARVEGVREVVRDGGARLRVTVVDAPRRIAALVGAVAELGVLEVTLQRPSLETVFLHHTGHAFEESRTPERAA
jgi:ABC-2 type transport system ATP-binding protein